MDKNKIKRYQFLRHVTLNFFFFTNDWNNANPRKSCQNRHLLIQMLHDSLNRYTRNLYGYEDSLHDRIVNDIFTEVLKPWPDKKQTVIYQLNGHSTSIVMFGRTSNEWWLEICIVCRNGCFTWLVLRLTTRQLFRWTFVDKYQSGFNEKADDWYVCRIEVLDLKYTKKNISYKWPNDKGSLEIHKKYWFCLIHITTHLFILGYKIGVCVAVHAVPVAVCLLVQCY